MEDLVEAWDLAPSDAEREVDLRLSQLTPETTVLGVFFRGVLDAVRALQGEEAMEQCREECQGARDFVDFFAYPASDFLRVLRRAGWVMEGKTGGFEETMRILGYLGMAAFLRSQAGRAVELLMSGTPRRVVENLPTAYKLTTPSGGPVSVVWWGQTGARILFTRDALPRPYLEGSLEAQLQKAGARGVRILGRALGPLSSEYNVAWVVE